MLRVLTANQCERIIAAPDPRYPTGRRNRIALGLIYRTGLTPQELSALRATDVDLPEGAIDAPGGQRLRARRLGLTADLVDALRKWIDDPARRRGAGGTAVGASQWLLPSIAEPAPGSQQDASYWSKMCRREGAEIGVEDVTARTLRDTWAAQCAASGQWTEGELAWAMGQTVESVRQYWAADPTGIADRMRSGGRQPRLEDAGGPELRRVRERLDKLEKLPGRIEAIEAEIKRLAERMDTLERDVRARFEAMHERLDGAVEMAGEIEHDLVRAFVATAAPPRRPLRGHSAPPPGRPQAVSGGRGTSVTTDDDGHSNGARARPPVPRDGDGGEGGA